MTALRSVQTGARAAEAGSTLPTQFDRYSILGHLATGGMAEVYLAHQAGVRGFEKLVVIKRIRPELLAEAGAVEAFLDEARLVATLEHPHIVQVLEVGFVAGSPFFVMEHVDGVDLRQLLEASLGAGVPLSLANALYIAIDVCAALHYAHERRDADDAPLGIIHRDVSPSNVLISHEGGVKICDFGIAKAATRSEVTQAGVVKGKFSYMSPEQCTNAPLDRRSDVFALGILLYELTTRTHLFTGANDYEVMRQIVDGPIPRPSTRVPGYPPELEAIVMRALAQHPADRYPTARALQSDLEELARERKLAMSSTHLASLMSRLFPATAPAAPARLAAPRLGWPRRSSLRLPRIAPRPVSRSRRATAVTAVARQVSTVRLPASVLAREAPPRRGRDAETARTTFAHPLQLAWLAGAILSALVAAVAALAAAAPHLLAPARDAGLGLSMLLLLGFLIGSRRRAPRERPRPGAAES
jgi:serine/threonine protein kinase